MTAEAVIGHTMSISTNGHHHAAPLAIVQHGHQYLITNSYDNREGIAELLESFAAVFALHLKYRVPLNLHLSGTLIEAIAWHAPVFLEWVRALRQEGLVELLGSAYSQNVMPLFSAQHNLRQLNETLWLYRTHLGVEPREIRGCWVPERVWNTAKLAPLLQSPQLLNGGYEYVLLDDRLSYPLAGEYAISDRQRFDAQTTPMCGQPGTPDDRSYLLPYQIAGSAGLVALPISTDLRC